MKKRKTEDDLNENDSKRLFSAATGPAGTLLSVYQCSDTDTDTKLGDNHWYIHDLPNLPAKDENGASGFEADLLEHMEALSTPEPFITSIRGFYEYSKVKVHLLTSIPGTHTGANKAEKYGILRLRRIVQKLDLGLAEKDKNEVNLEICTASLGKLNYPWLHAFTTAL